MELYHLTILSMKYIAEQTFINDKTIIKYKYIQISTI